MSIKPIIRYEVFRARYATLGVVVGIGAMMVLAVGMFSVMDTNVYEDLPEYLQNLLGIPQGASPAVLAYNSTLAVVGAATVVGLAIGVGARGIAGDEADRTLQLMLGLPVARSKLALAKAAALVTVVVLSSLALWLIAILGHLPFDIRLGQAHLGAVSIGLGANALLHGSLAFAVGAVTGNKAVALVVSSTLAALGWILAGVLPLWSRTENLVHFVPWHWYNGSSPLVNGISVGYLALTLVVTVAFFTLGTGGFSYRDLHFVPPRFFNNEAREPHPETTRPTSGTPSFFGLVFKQTAVLATSLGLAMLIFLALMGPLYNTMADELVNSFATLPPELLKIWDAPDMSTPEGFLWGEGMGLMAPLAVIVLGAVIMSKLLADEHSGRLGLLLAMPLSRSRVITTYLLSALIQVTWVSVATGLGIWVGSAFGNLGIAVTAVVGTTLHMLGLGLAVAAVVGVAAAFSNARSAASLAATVVGVGGYLIYVIMSLNNSTTALAKISPFYYYSSSQPLENGLNVAHLLVLVVAAVLAATLAIWAYPRRDLRV